MSNHRFEQLLQTSRLLLQGDLPGPRVVVMAGVHGDEPCGVAALQVVLPGLTLTRGSLLCLLGSRRAMDNNVRAYEENLNRMFRPDDQLSPAERTSYEYTRSRQLMPDLAAADVLLDIHSSFSTETAPFVICEPQSYDIAQFLPVATVVSGFDELHPTGTDAFVNQSGGLGMCIECGNHTDATAAGVAVTAVTNLLRGLDMIAGEATQYTQSRLTATSIYHAVDAFVPATDFADFAPVTAGQALGHDGAKVVTAPADGCVLFVRQQPAGGEAFVFAEVAK